MEEYKFVKITNENPKDWYHDKLGEIFKAFDSRDGFYTTKDGRGILKDNCKEATLLDLIERTHTEIITRDGIKHICVGGTIFNMDGTFYTYYDKYNENLFFLNNTKTYKDIMKIIYKDEVLWERPVEKKRVEMPFMECMKEFIKDDDKYYVECMFNKLSIIYNSQMHLDDSNNVSISCEEIVNGTWYLCER